MECRELEELARILDALAHPLRLAIIAILASVEGEMYLASVASSLGISRALAKIHLKKLERAGLVESRVVVEEGKAQARRAYKLSWRGRVEVSPELVVEAWRRCRRS